MKKLILDEGSFKDPEASISIGSKRQNLTS